MQELVIQMFSFSTALQPLLGQGLVIVEPSGSHSGTPHSVELWTSDQPDTEISIWQHTNHMRRTSMSPVVFEHAIPTSERLQTHALGSAPYLFIYLFI